jgi:hypothetical protein
LSASPSFDPARRDVADIEDASKFDDIAAAEDLRPPDSRHRVPRWLTGEVVAVRGLGPAADDAGDVERRPECNYLPYVRHTAVCGRLRNPAPSAVATSLAPEWSAPTSTISLLPDIASV